MSPTLQEAAALAGGHCWAERRVFELLGRWSATAAPPAASLALDRHSQHAAWRAGQWWERLPVLAGVDREQLVAPPPGWARATATLGRSGDAVSSPREALGALAVAYRVLLPRLAVAYAGHAARISPVADGPVARTLAQVRADVAGDWVEGEALLQDLLADPATVAAAGKAAATVEEHFTVPAPAAD